MTTRRAFFGLAAVAPIAGVLAAKDILAAAPEFANEKCLSAEAARALRAHWDSVYEGVLTVNEVRAEFGFPATGEIVYFHNGAETVPLRVVGGICETSDGIEFTAEVLSVDEQMREHELFDDL